MRNYVRMMRISLLLPIFVLAAGLFVGYAIVARAQVADEGAVEPTEEEIATSGISFPVVELGGCRDKKECKQFCDQPQNMPVCISFAEKHGLMSKKEAEFARKFKDKIDVGGPGGCRTPRDCEAYCSDITNIEECMAFAEEHGGIDDKNLEEGRKILTYIKSGGKMPGGCTSKESCEKYCSQADNMEECFEFAEKSGLGPPPDEDLSIEQMKKVMSLMKRGESPGGCKSKTECESYCNNPDNFEECVAFAEKAGFMRPEEVEMARKTGGKGPGGCRGPRECEAYCNAPENQEACFQFAQENGLIREDDLRRMKEGMVQMRAGLAQAPPEVVACLKSTMGPNIIDDIEAGRLVPGPAIGDRMRECFEKFHGAPEGGIAGMMGNAPPEVLSCLKEKFGDKFEEIKSGKAAPTLEMGDTFRVCFESARFKEGFEMGGPQGRPGGPMMGGAGGQMMGGPGMPPGGFGDFLKNAPPGIASCFKEKLGDELRSVQAGEIPPSPEFSGKIRECFESFAPRMQRFGEPGVPPPEREGGVEYKGLPSFDKPVFGVPPPPSVIPSPGSVPSPIGFDFQNLPTAAIDCVKRSFGGDVMEKLRSGLLSVPEFAAKAKACLFEAGGGVVLPPDGSGMVCAQVITPARDPQSGGCKNFPTPCDVPRGWEKVPSCDSSPAYVPPVGGMCPAMPTVDRCPEGQVKVEAFRSPECGTYYICKPVDGGTYQQPPSGGYMPPPGGNLLEVFKPLMFFLK